MRRSIISVLILSFATVLMGSVAASEIIHVPGDFGTIASAIDTAGTGDTIVVAPGTYREDIEIKKGMNLQGAGTDMTTLIGAIIVEDAAGVTILPF
jgi:pectin methylesterase-like acyl-CoA thioesterase